MLCCVTTFLPLCETWLLILRVERRLRVFENRVLRIFGAKKDEVTWGWRKLYGSPINVRVIQSRIMRWAGHVARMGRGQAYIGF